MTLTPHGKAHCMIMLFQIFQMDNLTKRTLRRKRKLTVSFLQYLRNPIHGVCYYIAAAYLHHKHSFARSGHKDVNSGTCPPIKESQVRSPVLSGFPCLCMTVH